MTKEKIKKQQERDGTQASEKDSNEIHAETV